MVKAILVLLYQFLKKIQMYVKANASGIICGWDTVIKGNVRIGKGSFVNESSEMITQGKDSLIQIGDHCYIGKRFLSATYENNSLIIGDKVGINNNVVLFGDVKVGSYSKFAFNIYVSSGKHFIDRHPAWLINDQDMDALKSREFVQDLNKPVEIHEDVWIGNGVVVMSGVKIGRGAVVGSNAVVTEDVAPYTIVGGIPAKCLKARLNFFPPTHISSNNDNDLPYFYEGFFHEREIRETFREGMLSKERSSIILARKGCLLHLELGGLKGFLKNKIRITLNGKELEEIILETDTFLSYKIKFQLPESFSDRFPFLKFEFQAESLYLTPDKYSKYSFVLKEAYVK